MNKIIGVVPAAQLFENNDAHDDTYNFVNNYCLRIIKNGGLPVGILPSDGLILEESIQFCDAILICGGRKIFPYHFQAVEYALKNNKKLLGICLGMQIINTYFIVEDEAKKRDFKGKLIDLYEIMKKEKYMFTLPVEHHWDVHVYRDNIEEAKHKVQILDNTKLQKIVNTNSIMAATMHNYKVNNVSPRLTISAYTEDGTVEALEYGDKVLGIQFHPEVDDKLNEFFEFLID